MEQPKTGLVVGAHSADFIWRAGDAIALHARQGWQITVVCLTFGEKGDSQKLWKDPSMTLDRVKADGGRKQNEPVLSWEFTICSSSISATTP
jgi:4-oxalomesaconate hydratase